MGNLREGLVAQSGAHLGPVPAPKTQCNRLEHESLSAAEHWDLTEQIFNDIVVVTSQAIRQRSKRLPD